ncbi:Helix-turn-helix domain-containing protein [Streptosporangium subroseum]|uniref:Helix-turn-helix domain-containing protein n=1 Tax=Streptosporangium subroseum TaxID=106412 RepID=A0A239AZ44_9ACTN|nr:helix-turn-helix transcriptional regulator [Streptosporangium subroseum]SNS01006.1 Helix-turn-helix domain-containing protein [Streptosporangium subroseum]
MMDIDNRLGEYLRARRELVTIKEVDLPVYGRRRTPGLRRDEVAFLAGISTDYYTRLEQGRELNPSDHVLMALARALQLDADASRYLYELARPHTRPPAVITEREQINPAMARFLRGWTDTPVFVISHCLDVLAANPLVDALFEDLDCKDNCLRMIFLSEGAPELYADWEKAASYKTAFLRAAMRADDEHPILTSLVEELSSHSAEFRRLWSRHDVRIRRNEIKELCHPRIGRVSLRWDAFHVSGSPGQQLLVLAPEPGSPSEEALATLNRARDSTSAQG